jgi:uncharacterized cupredoxin-like copper-binding protein
MKGLTVMKRLRRGLVFSMMLALAAVVAACGGGSGAATPNQPASGASSGALEISSDGENMAFAPTTLTAKTGETVTVNFKNTASGLQHNWVLVKGGDDVAAAINTEATTAGPDNGYLPADKSNILSASKLLNPGQSESFSFTAPAAGTYSFICTVPGHFALGMKGTLTVTQ